MLWALHIVIKQQFFLHLCVYVVSQFEMAPRDSVLSRQEKQCTATFTKMSTLSIMTFNQNKLQFIYIYKYKFTSCYDEDKQLKW